MQAVTLAKRAMSAVLAHQRYMGEYTKPMSALVVRWSGKGVPHVGKALDAAITRALAESSAGVTFRGWLTKGKKHTRYAAPKPHGKVLTEALATLKTMPLDPTKLYFKDGDPKSLVPDRFAMYASLSAEDRSFATDLGWLGIALPIEDLDKPRCIALGDALVKLLAAEVAWFGPAMWLAPQCLFNSSTNEIDSPDSLIELFAQDPQVDIPSVTAHRHPYGPAGLEGFLAPAWVMWASAKLAKKVKRFGGEAENLKYATRYTLDDEPPFAMTAARYTKWRARWDELAPLHLTSPDTDEVAPYYLGRFAAKTLDAVGKQWRDERAAQQAKQQRSWAIKQEIDKLAKKPGPKLLAYADSIAKELDIHSAWVLLPALRELLDKNRVEPGVALVWCDLCEQLGDYQLLPKLASVATGAGDHVRAIDLLRRAIDAHSIQATWLKRDPTYKALRKHPGFAKLVR